MFLIDRGPGPVSCDPKRLAEREGFSPPQLFAGGAPGVWFDPSDRATLFEDAAGTIPVTQPGQPVGLMLDKSRGLLRGAQLVDDPEFDGLEVSPIWKPQGAAALPPALASGRLVVTTTGGSTGAYFTLATRIGATYEVEFSKLPGGTIAVVRINTGEIPSTSPIIDAPSEAGRAIFTATTTSTVIYLRHASSGVTEWEGVSVRELPGRHAAQAVAASRPTLIQDEAGHYGLSFDGVDDFMVTSAIDLTGTDKLGVFAGLRKLGAVNAILVELSAGISANNGAFKVNAPYESPNHYSAASRGDVALNVSQDAFATDPAFVSPHTAVLAAQYDISGDSVLLGVNGASKASAPGDQGFGSFGRYPLYIGRRAGASLPFTGNLHGLIVAGKLPSAAEISGTEAFLNRNTGAF